MHSIIHSFVHSFIHQWLYSTLLGPALFFSFVIFFVQTVGLPGRVISPSQGRYLYGAIQTKNKRTRTHTHTHTDIRALSGIRTHDPSLRVSEDSSCLGPRGHCDRQNNIQSMKLNKISSDNDVTWQRNIIRILNLKSYYSSQRCYNNLQQGISETEAG
jgi:hypothetical protein